MTAPEPSPPRPFSDAVFWAALGILGGVYVLLIVAMLLAQASFTTPGHLLHALDSPEIRYAVKLSLLSCTLTTILSLWVAVPLCYIMSLWDDGNIRRFLDRFAAPIERFAKPWYLRPIRLGSMLIRLCNPKLWLDAILDIPIVLPPLVIGLALLILFQSPLARWFENSVTPVTFAVPSVIVAQFAVAAAFAARTMRATFDHINPREE